MTMILTSVTMVGWADVPDSDWGYFRRRRAVDISSSHRVQPKSLLRNGRHIQCEYWPLDITFIPIYR